MPLKEITDEIRSIDAKIAADLASTPEDSFEKIKVEDEQKLWQSRRGFFFRAMMKSVSPEKLPALEQFAKRLLGDEAYDRVVQLMRKNGITDEYLAPKMNNQILIPAKTEGLCEICSIVGEETVERAWEEANAFVPEWMDSTPIHPLEESVNSLKARLPELEPDEEKREKLSADLYEINSLVTETNPDYSREQTSKNADYSHVINVEVNTGAEQLFQSGAFGTVGEYIKLDDNKMWFAVQGDINGNMQLKSDMQSAEVKYNPEYKAKIIAVLKRMDELGLASEDAAREEGSKVYGFRKLVDAQTALKTAVKEGDVQNISRLKEEYVKQVEVVRELYAMVDDVIPPDNRCVPDNVDNMRSGFIPAEFKKSVSTNSNFNSLWITLSFVKATGTTIEEFVEKPISYLRGYIQKEIDKVTPAIRFEGKSLADILVADAWTNDGDYAANWLGTLRATDALCGGDIENRSYNNGAVRLLEQEIKISSPPVHCFIEINANSSGSTPRKTLSNMFLVSEKDRDLYRIASEPNKSRDGFTKYPPFDPVKYVNEHEIDFQAMADKIGNTVREFSEKVLAQGAKEIPLGYDVVDVMESAMEAAAKALLIKNPDPSEPGVKAIGEFLENPLKSLGKYGVNRETITRMYDLKRVSKRYLTDPIDRLQKMSRNLKKLSSDKEKEIKGYTSREKSYNEKADTILKEAERISKQVAKEKDTAKVEKLQIESVKKMNELKALQKSEVEKLEKAFKDGKITAYYLKNRTEKIGSLNHNEKTAMFEADAFPSKSDYIKSTGLEELTSDEKKGLYESAKLRAMDEKQKFLGLRILENGKLIDKEEISADGVSVKANFNLIDVNALEKSAESSVVSVDSAENLIDTERENIIVTEAIDKEEREISVETEEKQQPVISSKI